MTAPVKASLMITRLGDLFFPDAGVAVVRLLRRLGVIVECPEAQTCCRMLLFNAGCHDDAAAVAARTVDLFAGSEHVVVPSGSCAWSGWAAASTGRRTGDEAREIVLALCRERGVRMAVKSKFMATEEIELNDALERAGVTLVETDLGEYIIHLAHEKDVHAIFVAAP